LLYLLLYRHLGIIKLAQKRVLHEKELASHVKSLMSVFSVFDERTRQLECMSFILCIRDFTTTFLPAIFLQVHRNSETQFESFAYGMVRPFLPSSWVVILIRRKFHASIHNKEKKPSENTLLTFKDNKVILEELQETSNTQSINSSILTKGLGPSFEFEEVGLKKSKSPPGHIPHSLEGAWTGKCMRANNQQIAFQGFFQCIIDAIVNGFILGRGESYLGPVEIEGDIERCYRPSSGNIPVDFRINSDLYADLWCRGEYNPGREVIHGQWVIADDSGEFPPADDSEKEKEMDFRIPCGRLYMTRTPPCVFRFRDILDSALPNPSTRTIARRRWRYACEAITFQLQNSARSGNFLRFLRARIVERRKWVELTIRRELDKILTDAKPQLSEDGKNELWTLRLRVHPTNGRLYDRLSLYLFKRMFYNMYVHFLS
jgi:hypothetical protein